MSGKEVASIVWIALSGGTKLLAMTAASVLSGKVRVRNAKRVFKKHLKRHGLPEEMVNDLAEMYTLLGTQMLSIRHLIGMLRQVQRQEALNDRNMPA